MKMASTVLGVDIGSGTVKLALCKGGKIRKTAVAPMPENLLKDGRITSPESMGELIRAAMRMSKIRASAAALVLPSESCYIRTITMPVMGAEELKYNIPYEFNDYITGELKSYVFDYTVTGLSEQDGESLELLCVAGPLDLLESSQEMLRKAGLKMVRAAPAEIAYISLIRRMEQATSRKDREYCIVDLGYTSIRMYMFKGERYEVTRILEVGLSSLDDVIADNMETDVHLAHTYLLTNYEQVQEKDFCVNAYTNIAVELMRSLNFYRFSNPDSTLNDVWLCGGGAAIQPLCDTISQTLDMTIHKAGELIESTGAESPNDFVRAVGITIE